MMLIPSIGYQIAEQSEDFNLFINGWLYQPLHQNFDRLGKTIWGTGTSLIDSWFSGYGQKLIKNSIKTSRIESFFVRNLDEHSVEISIDGKEIKTIKTDTHGRFVFTTRFVPSTRANLIKYQASDKSQSDQSSEGTIFLMKQHKTHQGCSIISDIDDTIKISEVPNKAKLIYNTFINEFQAVPGMANLYRQWESKYNCLFHYVSAMPAQLYWETKKFLDQSNFPAGSFHMRHMTLIVNSLSMLFEQISALISTNSSQIHKLNTIREILRNAPKSQEFVLLGDSGESDPETYGIIAREHPQRIKKIFIRTVDGGENENKRFLDAFREFDVNKWKLFSEASSLPDSIFQARSTDSNQSEEEQGEITDEKLISSATVPFRFKFPLISSIHFVLFLHFSS